MEDPTTTGLATKPLVMPTMFPGKDMLEWGQYVQSFEACADLNGWDNTLKCKFLAVRLTGQAAKVYFYLEEAIRQDWVALKDALGSRLDSPSTPELSKSEFLARSRKSNESIIEFGNCVRHLARQAYSTLSATVRDELAKDQFIRGLSDRDMVIRLRQSKPVSLDDAIKLALEYETICIDVDNSVPKNSPKMVASASSSNSKLEEMMAEMLTLMKDERSQQTANRSTTNRSTRRGRNHNYTCYECGSPSHFRKNCPNLIPDKTRRCWHCGDERHLRDQCPK